MRGRVSKIRKRWYQLGLPKMYYLTVWIATGIALSVSILELFLWATDAEVIHTGNFWFPMHIIDSICIVLASSAIIFQRTGIQPRLMKYFSLIAAVFIAIMSITPGMRMTLYEAAAFLLIGFIIWLLQIGKPGLAHFLNIPVALISYFYLMGYILGIYSDIENHLVPLALTTSIAMVSFCTAVFLISPHTWLNRVFASGRISGIIARQLLLPLIILPVIIGWFRIHGEKQGIFNSEVGVVLVALTYTFCFVILVWFAARSVDKVDRKRLESEEISRRSHTRMELLSEIASRLLVSDDPQRIITELCNEIMDFLNCQVFINYLVDYSENKLHLNAFSGIPVSESKKIEWLDFGTAVSGCVARDGVRIIDETIQESTNPGTELIRGLGINVYACHPLLSHDKVIGTLSFGSNLRRKFSEDDLSLMKIVADQVAIAMGRIQNEKDLRENIAQRKKEQQELVQLNRTLNALGKSSQAMMHTNNELQYLREVCKILIEDCGHMMVWIGYARNDERKTVEPVAYYGLEKGYIDQLNVTWDHTERGKGPTGTAIRTGKPTICRNMLTDPDFKPWREQAVKRGYASSVVLPLLADGKAFGAVSIYSREPDVFSDDDVKLLSNLANDLAYGITNIRLTESERRAAKTIRESEEKYRLLFEEMTEGFALHEIILDDHGNPFDYRFISVNPAFEKQTGLKAQDVIGKTAREVLPSTEKYWIDNYGKVALEGKTMDFENYSSALNSYFRVSAFSPGRGYFAVIFENITERIAAENEVRTSKEKLDLALDNANIGIWTWDIKNNKFDWDERVGRMFGLKGEAIQSVYEEFEKYIYEEDVSHFTRAIQKARDEDVPLDTIFRTKLRSGELKYIDAKARVEKDNQGKAVKMTGVCLDITAMKKTTEKSLFKLNEDLLRSNRELEQFAYVASHDLQEPLRMVSSFTQLLSARYKDKLDQQAQEFISFAVDGAQRMQRLINDLLQYSRIQTRGKSLLMINMNDILKQTLHNLGIRIRERKAVVTSDPLPEVFADNSQMLQLFQNLIENGIKFCDNNPRVHITAVEDNDQFIFSVHDNGIGIEPQYFERIFQIFQRLHLKDEYGGTGIGLAICKRIVERHGGKIWVESAKNNGTTFKFSLRKA